MYQTKKVTKKTQKKETLNEMKAKELVKTNEGDKNLCKMKARKKGNEESLRRSWQLSERFRGSTPFVMNGEHVKGFN